MVVDQQLQSRLGALSIPVLPEGVPDLIKALSDENLKFHDMAARIEHFPSIVARLISLSNSAWSAPAEPIITMEQAIGRLGMKVVRSVSIALAVSAPLNTSRCPAFKAAHYWADVLLVADIAAILAEHTHDIPPIGPASARVAGLIHNLGLLLMVDRFPEQADESFRSYGYSDKAQPLNEIVQSTIGISPAQAGSLIARNWELPDALCVVMTHFADRDYHDDYWSLVATVAAAIRLTAALNEQRDTIPEADQAEADLFLWDQVAERWDEMIGLHARTNLLAQQVFS